MRFVARLALIALLLSSPLIAQNAGRDPVLAAMKQELEHSLAGLKKQPVPPYFLSYQVTDNRSIQVSASFGTLMGSEENTTRQLDIDLRVGDHDLDNTHPMRGGMPDFGGSFSSATIPFENDSLALRQNLWFETDKKYRDAVERLEQVKANVQVKIEQEDKSGDFSSEKPASYYEPEGKLVFDRAAWEQRARKYSAPFAKYKDIYAAGVQVSGEIETRRYVNSDGTEIQYSGPFYRLMISAVIKAEDGMELPLYRTYMSFHPEGLPDDATVMKDVDTMIQNLLALRKAPQADAYTGPAILSGRASAVFFHEIFGHRVEGQRQKGEEEAQTFRKKVNQSVLPDFLSVYSDPTELKIGSEDLVGSYLYDDEGVKAERVPVVQKGILRNFLMSRTPIEGFPHSNGHGRRQQGFPVAARQSNLLVEASVHVSREELKKKLIELVKSSGKPYGLYFDDIEGGYTFTQRYLPNAFNVLPTLVYRVYPDGREELVRGVNLIGTPLIAFSKITAADDAVGVFNGMCGAESGWVPVSAVSPGLLVSQIETQRKDKSQERPPILPPPFAVEKIN